MRRWVRRWWPFVLLVALAATFVILFVQVSNEQRNIQQSRLHSCQRTYSSFPEVFRPFFPADMKKWTPRVRRNWAKLVKETRRLAANCSQQTKP